MKTSRQSRFILPLLLAAMLPGCALRSQNSGGATPATSVASRITPHCSDRVDRAKTAGFVGSVLGTIAASVIGSPFLGVFYQTAGYIMGFASESPCPKANPPAQSNGSGNEPQPSSPPVIDDEGL